MVGGMVQHIGIVACSAEGAALCYRTICVEGGQFLGKYAHPEVTMHTFSLQEYMRYIEDGDWGEVARLMLASVVKVAEVGADFAICPDNTIHQAFDQVIGKSPIPWIHIAEAVALEAVNQKYHHLGILGTRYLMDGPVYPSKLSHHSIDYSLPTDDERLSINDIILNELVDGQITAKARSYFQGVINNLKDRGCDAVVLGCTEIPLLITQESSSLPVLDSTRILARAALKRAIGGEAVK